MSKTNGKSYEVTEGTYQPYESKFQPDSDLEKEILPYLEERMRLKLIHDPDLGKQLTVDQIAEIRGVSNQGVINLIGKKAVKSPPGFARGKKTFFSKRDTAYLKHLPRIKSKDNSGYAEYTLSDIAEIFNITKEEAEVLIFTELGLTPRAGIDYQEGGERPLELRIDYKDIKKPKNPSNVRINPHDVVALFNRVFPKDFNEKTRSKRNGTVPKERDVGRIRKDRKSSINDYFNDIKYSRPLSPQREIELSYLIQGGDEAARRELIEANLRFVVSIAKQYLPCGLELSDLISAGNLGLITAAERFDGERGFKFISYAVHWIRQSILQTLAEQSRTVRLPLNRVGQVMKINKILARQVNADASPEEVEVAIAEELSVDQMDVDSLRTLSEGTISLDQPLEDDDDEGRTLQNLLVDETQPPADEQILTNQRREIIAEQLNALQERDARILRMYYGLDGEEPMTLEAIGSYLGVTRERTRQIKEKALAKLRRRASADRILDAA